MTAASAVRVEQQGTLCVVFLRSDVDLAVASQVVELGRAMVETTAADGFEVDVAAVRFIDSSGIGALVALRNAAAERNLPFRIVSAAPAVRRVLEIAGVSSVLGVDRAVGWQQPSAGPGSG